MIETILISSLNVKDAAFQGIYSGQHSIQPDIFEEHARQDGSMLKTTLAVMSSVMYVLLIIWALAFAGVLAGGSGFVLSSLLGLCAISFSLSFALVGPVGLLRKLYRFPPQDT